MAARPTHRLFQLRVGPGRWIVHQRGNYRMVQLVAAAYRAIGADQRSASKRQIAERIDRLVADELVGETYAIRIEHAIFGDYDRILEGGAERIASIP